MTSSPYPSDSNNFFLRWICKPSHKSSLNFLHLQQRHKEGKVAPKVVSDITNISFLSYHYPKRIKLNYCWWSRHKMITYHSSYRYLAFRRQRYFIVYLLSISYYQHIFCMGIYYFDAFIWNYRYYLYFLMHQVTLPIL